jgi:hypothetical protein
VYESVGKLGFENRKARGKISRQLVLGTRSREFQKIRQLPASCGTIIDKMFEEKQQGCNPKVSGTMGEGKEKKDGKVR